ncbi:hypothetical protein LTS18_012140, partial [Coniosporium uncinatum]
MDDSRASAMKRTRHTSRASLACTRCKKAKRRCDVTEVNGVLEPCTSCKQKGERCDVRLSEDKRRSKHKQSTSDLQQRIAALEEMIAKNDTTPELDSLTRESLNVEAARLKGGQRPVPLEPRFQSQPPPMPTSQIQSSQASPRTQQTTPGSSAARTSTTPVSSALMDEVTARSGQLKGRHSSSMQYFGPTSMYIHSEKDYIPKSADKLISQICPDESAKAVLEQLDEPEPIVTHLLALFWTYQASCLNVVNRTTFCRHRKFYEEDPGSEKVSCYSPCLLYAILALASMISPDKGVRKYSTGAGGTPGETFYRKAKVLLELELSRPTATTVQAAVLVGSWFGATGHYSLGWTWSGVAFRMAIEVGLHLDCSRAVANGHLDADAAENRTKAFWCCYVQDKFWSSHTGRPCFFMDWDITLEVPGGDAEAVERMSQRDRCTTLSERNIIFLAILMSKTLLALYRQRHTSTMEELCKCASSIHKELIQWHRDLPEILSWPRAEGEAPPSPHIFVMHM